MASVSSHFLLESLEVVILSSFAAEKIEALRRFYMSKVTQLVSDGADSYASLPSGPVNLPSIMPGMGFLLFKKV